MRSSLQRCWSGWLGNRSGTQFEAALEITHDSYRRHRIADVIRLPVPTRAAPQKLRRQTGIQSLRVLEQRQRFDYMGSFGPKAGPSGTLDAWNGITIAMEAKRSSERSASLPIVAATSRGQGIMEHQLRSLADAALFGVVACIVWRNADERLVALTETVLEAWREYEAGGRRSIPAVAFVPYDAVTDPTGVQVEDWLYPVRLHLEMARGGRAS